MHLAILRLGLTLVLVASVCCLASVAMAEETAGAGTVSTPTQATEVPAGTLDFIITVPETITDSFDVLHHFEIGDNLAACDFKSPDWRVATDTPLCAAFGADVEYTTIQKVECAGRRWNSRRTVLGGPDGLIFSRWEFTLPYTEDDLGVKKISLQQAHWYAGLLYLQMLAGCVHVEKDLADNIDFPWHGYAGNGTYVDYRGVQVRYKWQYRAVAITYLSPLAAERWDFLESLEPLVEPEPEPVGLLLPH